MNLHLLLGVARRRGWIVVALGAIGAMAGYGFALTRVPVYEAEARVSIQAARPADLGQTQAINGVLRSFAADVVTAELADEVARILGGWDPDALKAHASAQADEGAREVKSRFRWGDPAVAEAVADTWATVFEEGRRQANLQLDQRERVFAVKRDTTTHHLYWPRKKLLTVAGGAAAAGLGVALALVLEFAAAATVRGPDDLLGIGEWIGSVPTEPQAAEVAVRSGAWSWSDSAAAAAGLVGGVLALGMLGAVVAYGLSGFSKPTYRARTRIAIEPARTSDWGQTQAIREILRGFSEDISTRRMAGEVSRRLQLDLPAPRLLEKLRVAPSADVYEIWLDVLDGDPAEAEAISRTWAQVFAEERDTANQELDARDRIYARLRDRTPAELFAPRPATNALAGGVIGALAGLAAVAASRLGRRRLVAGVDDARPVGATLGLVTLGASGHPPGGGRP